MMLGLVNNEYSYYLMFDMFNPAIHPNYKFTREEFVNFVPLRTYGILYNEGNAFFLDAILSQYEKSLRMPYNGTYVDVLDELVGDYLFKCAIIPFAQQFNKTKIGSESVYLFSFENRASNTPYPEWMGVVHADEIAYQMGLPTDPKYKYNKNEAELSKKMMNCWVNFAKTGKPNGNSPSSNTTLTLWPQYTQDKENYLILETKDTGVYLRHKQCLLWTDYMLKLHSSLANSTLQAQWIKSLKWFINGDL